MTCTKVTRLWKVWAKASAYSRAFDEALEKSVGTRM
jgi:hypothetical protein